MKKLRKLMILITLIFALSSSVFSYSVFAAEDVTQLQIAYDSAEAAMNTQSAAPIGDPYYEIDSYQAFTDTITGLGGLVSIQAVIDEPTSLQVDVNNLTTNINNALTSLTLKDTYYSTLAEFSTANSIVLTPYTSDSQALYNAEMDRIEAILNIPTSGEIVIEGLNTDISSASDLLVLRGDKTNLNSLIIQIETIYDSIGDEYIPSTFTSFKNSYDNIDTLLVVDPGKSLQEIVQDIDSIVSEVETAESRLNDVLVILVLRSDKTQLQSDYNTALTVDSSLYTSSSFTLFINGLELIEDVIEDLEVVEAGVTQAITDLLNLYSVLVVKGDITDLQIAYNNAISQDISIYTPNSQIDYQNELNRINHIMLSDDTNQVDTDQALVDTQVALNLLLLQANRTNLEVLNTLLIKAYYENGELYTASSHEAFKTACNVFGSYLSVNAVIIDDNVTQDQVDTLEASIQAALDLLVLRIDNTGLLMVYYDLHDSDLSGYTTNSQIDYDNELDRLYQIIIGDEFDSISAAGVLFDLSALKYILVELPDYTELQSIYDSINIYREEDYSISSYSIYNSAIIYAEYMLTNNNATQENIDATIVILKDSVKSLQQTIEPVYIREKDTLDITQYITLGQSHIVNYDLEDVNIVSVDSDGIIKGLSYGSTFVTVTLSNGAIETIEVHVTAGIKIAVYVMTFSIPVVTVGLGSVVLFGRKETWLKLVTKVKDVFKKKQKK